MHTDNHGAGRSSDLFREEVVARFRSSPWQPPLLSKPVSWPILALLALGATSLVLVFSVSFEFARKEQVQGHLSPRGGWAKLVANRSGVVSQLFVTEGAVVRLGEQLLEIAAWDGLGPSLTVRAKMLSEIHARRQVIGSQKGLARRNYSAERESLIHSIEAAREDLRALEREIELAVIRRERGDHHFSVSRELHIAGVISEIDLARAEDEFRLRQLAESEKRRMATSISNNLKTLKSQFEQIKVERDIRLAALEDQLHHLALEEAQASLQGGALLLAPRDGVVASLRVGAGDAVHGGERLLDIVPEDASMIAELIVGSSAIGFLEKNQEVRVYLDAFPFEQYGSQTGRIVNVAPTAIDPLEFGMTDAPLTGPLFRVTVEFPEGLQVPAAGLSALKPGSTLSADLIRDRSTLFEWLVEPVKGAAERM